ncbi:MAG: putative amino-acid metabolite efflux pump [Syntrophomonadaceae bacterium]|nr:putative amino-acid metabolite efflux pump [Bacillota bacterium]
MLAKLQRDILLTRRQNEIIRIEAAMRSVNPYLLAIPAILATTILWGLSFSSTKVLLETLPPGQIAFLRLVPAVLALAAAFVISRPKPVSSRDLPRVALGGAFGTFLYFLFENNGLRFTSAGTGSLIISTIPVLNVMAGVILFGERPTPRRWFGVLLSVSGVYLLISKGGSGELSLANMQGNILILLAACSWVAYTRICEPLLSRYNGLSLTFYQSLVGLVLFGLLNLPAPPDAMVLSQGMVLFNLAYLGIFCSALAYLFYLFSLKILGTATVTSFINLIPVFGVLGGAVLLNEVLTAGQLLGGAVVLSGVSLVTVPDSGKRKPAASCAGKSG